MKISNKYINYTLLALAAAGVAACNGGSCGAAPNLNSYAYVAAANPAPVGASVGAFVLESTVIYRYVVDKSTGKLTYDNYSITVPYSVLPSNSNNILVAGNNLYISGYGNPNNGSLLVYSINANNGDLTLTSQTDGVPGSSSPSNPGFITSYKDQYLYSVADTSDQIDLFNISSSALNYAESYLPTTTLADTYAIAVNNKTKTLYSFGGSNINTQSIAADGSLTFVSQSANLTSCQANSAIVHSNTLYFVCNYNSSGFNYYNAPLGANGSLPADPQASLIATPNNMASSAWQPVGMGFGSKLAYVADMHNSTIWYYSIGVNGAITPLNESVNMPSGSVMNPYWVAIYPAS